MKPTNTPALSSTLDSTLGAAYELLNAGRIAEADQLCQGLLALTPNTRTAVLASAIAEARSDMPRALEIVNAAIEHHGENADLLLKQAQVLMQLRRRKEGVAAVRRAAALCPADARLLQAIAKVHVERNEPAEAKPLLLRACELMPTDPAILYDTAVSHFYLNEMDEAATLLERVLTVAPGNGFALYIRSQLGTQTPAKNHVEYLRKTLLRPQIRKVDAISSYFALAKELEDIGDYEESFAALSEGNRVKRSTLDYDVGKDVHAMQNVMSHYSREALARAAPGEPTTGPIFIVGMPRTERRWSNGSSAATRTWSRSANSSISRSRWETWRGASTSRQDRPIRTSCESRCRWISPSSAATTCGRCSRWRMATSTSSTSCRSISAIAD